MLIEGNFEQEGSLFHIVALLSRDSPPVLVGEEALGVNPDLDMEMLRILWRLPDFRDLETKPDLIAFSMCGSEKMAHRRIQAMARWLSKRRVGFKNAVFEIYSYGDVQECLVHQKPWTQPDQDLCGQSSGRESNVVRLRID